MPVLLVKQRISVSEPPFAGSCPAICRGLLRSPASATLHSNDLSRHLCISRWSSPLSYRGCNGLRKSDIGRSSGQPAQPSPVRHQCGSSVDRRSSSHGAYYRCSRQFPLAPSARAHQVQTRHHCQSSSSRHCTSVPIGQASVRR